MTHYDPNSPFPPPDRDRESGSVGEQYSFDSPQYQPVPPESSWPGQQPPPTTPYNPYPPTAPVSSQPVTAYPVSPTPQFPVSPTQPYSGPPAQPYSGPPQGYSMAPPPMHQPVSTTSFMSAGRVWATVGIVIGVVILLPVLLCTLGAVRF